MSLIALPALPGIAFPVVRSPKGSRIRHKSVSGKTTSQTPQPYPLYGYDLPYEFLRSSSEQELQSLLGFWTVTMFTNSGYFRFNDPDDNAVVNQQLGVGDGVATDFGFVRPMGISVDPIQDATSAGLVVRVDGVVKTINDDFTLLTTTQFGSNYAIRFNAAPANGAVISADFGYSWICELDDDSSDFSKFMDKLWEVGSLKFTSVFQ